MAVPRNHSLEVAFKEQFDTERFAHTVEAYGAWQGSIHQIKAKALVNIRRSCSHACCLNGTYGIPGR